MPLAFLASNCLFASSECSVSDVILKPPLNNKVSFMLRSLGQVVGCPFNFYILLKGFLFCFFFILRFYYDFDDACLPLSNIFLFFFMPAGHSHSLTIKARKDSETEAP
jgi:hypothetical protein